MNRDPFPLVPFVIGVLGLLFSLAALILHALPASGATPEPAVAGTLLPTTADKEGAR